MKIVGARIVHEALGFEGFSSAIPGDL